MGLCRIGVGVLVLSTCQTALAQDFGFDWATVGDPGNRMILPGEGGSNPDVAPMISGAVDYEYRIMRTEVTVVEQLAFARAYWPYAEGSFRSRRELIGGDFIGATDPFADHDEDPGFFTLPEFERRPAAMTYRMWARFANWLHNDKADEAAAFESGVYDTSTFGRDSDGFLTDQIGASPGARLWIPTIDEWTKAMHWDPDLNEGKGGYWTYANSSHDVPIADLPENGGNTDATLYDLGGDGADVDAYPDDISPWGLLGGIGGEREAMDGLLVGSPDRRFVYGIDGIAWYEPGDAPGPLSPFQTIHLQSLSGASESSLIGVRFATRAIPAPGVIAIVLVGMAGIGTRTGRTSS